MKNILITGSSDGIGKLAAIRFAKEGHSLYLHGRDQKKLTSVIEEVKAESGNDRVDGFIADFSNLDEVREMANQIKKQLSHIDILINNAGVFKSSENYNKDGLDLRFVVNYVSHYLLTKELLPLLKRDSGTRIINLSSAAQASISYGAVLNREPISMKESYAQSKLALTMWSLVLSNQLEGVTVIAVNPGSLLNTKMANEAYGQHWSPAEKGSDILYDMAISKEHEDKTGKYFDNDNRIYAYAHPDMYDQEALDQLIEVTESIIG